MGAREKLSEKSKTRTVHRIRIGLPVLSYSSSLSWVLLEGLLSEEPIVKSEMLIKGKNKFRIVDPDQDSYIEVSLENSSIIIRYTEPLSEKLGPLLQFLIEYIRSLRDYLYVVLIEHLIDNERIMLCLSDRNLAVKRVSREVLSAFEKCLFKETANGRLCKSYGKLVADIHMFQDLVHLSQILKTRSILLCIKSHKGNILIVRDSTSAWRVAKLLYRK